MYRNWFRFGDTEVVNNTRVAKYVENGLKPVGGVVPHCDDCPDIWEATGDEEYDTPVLDGAPWFREEDPDSADFAGVMATAVTGLGGSTIKTEVIERVSDGGMVGSRRAESRVIQVTADIVGRTPAATAVGLEWLSAALHPPCSSSGGCQGEVLHLFSACPETCFGQTDPDSAFITSEVPLATLTVERGTTSTITTTARTNVVTHPSFELDGNSDGTPDGWSAYNGGVNGGITRELRTDLGGVTSGTKAQRIVSSAQDNAVGSFAGVSTSAAMALAPGAAYARVDMQALILPAGHEARMFIQCRNSSNSVISTVEVTATVSGTMSLSFTAPAGTTNALMYLVHRGSGAGDPTATRVETLWDSALLVQGAATDYFSGDTTDTPAFTYAWTGTVNASTSTATGTGNWLSFDHQPQPSSQDSARTLVLNPLVNSATSWQGGSSTLSMVTEDGRSVLRSAVTAAGGSTPYVLADIPVFAAGSATNITEVVTLKVTGAAGTQAIVQVRWQDAGGTELQVETLGYVPTGSGFQTFRVTGINVPPTAVKGAVIAYWSGPWAAGNSIFLDVFSVTTNGAEPFDGDTLDRTFAYSWTGATNASASTRTRVADRTNQFYSPVFTTLDDVFLYGGSASSTQTVPDAKAGSTVMRISTPPVSGLSSMMMSRVSPNDNFSARFWIRLKPGLTGTRSIYISNGAYDAGINGVGGLGGLDWSGNIGTDWTEVILDTTPDVLLPPSAAWLGVQVLTSAPTGGATAWVSATDAYEVSAFLSSNTQDPLPFFYGGTPDDATYLYTWAGLAGNSFSRAYALSQQGRIISPLLPGICDEVTVSWLVTGSGAEAAIQLLDSTGAVVQQSNPVIVDGTTTLSLTVNPTPEFPGDWRTALLVNGDVATRTLVSARPVLAMEDCIEPYQRTFHNVVTIDGPKVVEEKTLGDTTDGSSLWSVEWTWVATEPNAWHEPVDLLAGVAGKANTETYSAPGIQITDVIWPVGHNATLCPRPAASFTSDADNANLAALVLPPQAPILADPNVMNLAGANYTRRRVEIPAGLMPTGLGAFSWVFDNDASAKLGIRVRIWEKGDDPAFVAEPECEFVQEFYIDYLKANHTMFIDGPTGEVYVQTGTELDGTPVFAPADKNVRGTYGGPFDPQPVGCGRGYVISVDVPDTYTATGGSEYTSGGSQGDLTWSLDLTRRA